MVNVNAGETRVSLLAQCCAREIANRQLAVLVQIAVAERQSDIKESVEDVRSRSLYVLGRQVVVNYTTPVEKPQPTGSIEHLIKHSDHERQDSVRHPCILDCEHEIDATIIEVLVVRWMDECEYGPSRARAIVELDCCLPTSTR